MIGLFFLSLCSRWFLFSFTCDRDACYFRLFSFIQFRLRTQSQKKSTNFNFYDDYSIIIIYMIAFSIVSWFGARSRCCVASRRRRLCCWWSSPIVLCCCSFSFAIWWWRWRWRRHQRQEYIPTHMLRFSKSRREPTKKNPKQYDAMNINVYNPEYNSIDRNTLIWIITT